MITLYFRVKFAGWKPMWEAHGWVKPLCTVGQQTSLGQAQGSLPPEAGFIPSPGAGALVTITTALSGAWRHSGGHLSSQSFCYLLYQLNTFLWTLVPMLVLRPLRMVCVFVPCLQFLHFALWFWFISLLVFIFKPNVCSPSAYPSSFFWH